MKEQKLHSTYKSILPEDTKKIGIYLGKTLNKGAILSFQGALAAGKTTLIKGIAQSLGIEDEITSPTFTIISSYNGKYILNHIDLYRIESSEELEYLGIDEIIYSNGISVIEWGEKLKIIAENLIEIKIEIEKDFTRKITISGLQKNLDIPGIKKL